MYVSILVVRVLLSELRRRGISEERFLEGTSLDPELIPNPRATIDIEEWAALLIRATEITGDPAIGLSMGEHWSQSMLQVVGQLIGACRTLREAFSLFDRYRALIGNNLMWTLEEHGDRAYLYIDPKVSHPVAARIGLEAVMIFVYRLGRTFVPAADPMESEVWFRHAAPEYQSQYARVFGCVVRFERPRYAFAYPRWQLDVPHSLGDDMLREVLRNNAEALLRERDSHSIAERVRAILRYEQDVAHIDVQRIAKQLGLNVRALRRKLGAERAPLSNLLDEARLRVAQRALAKPDVSIKEVAHDLGFSEASAFHRAFKRWSGQTPAQYVRQALEEQLGGQSDASNAQSSA
jgi:AraC-like DNA-binding protein